MSKDAPVSHGDSIEPTKNKPTIITSLDSNLIQAGATTDGDVRETIPIPDAPSAEEFENDPFPHNWREYGFHVALGKHESRLFASTIITAHLPHSLHIRYIHPANDMVKIVSFPATTIQDGRVVPQQLQDTVEVVHDLDIDSPDDVAIETLKQNGARLFPLSFGVSTFDQQDKTVSPPSPAERTLIWSLFGDLLKNQTKYLPPEFATEDNHVEIRDR